MAKDINKLNYEVFNYRISGIFFGVIFVLLAIFLFISQKPLLTTGLAHSLLIIGTSISGLFASFFGFIKQRAIKEKYPFRHYLFFSSVTSLAIGFVSGMGGYLFTILAPYAFKNLPYTRMGTTLLIASLSALTCFFVLDFIFRINQKRFSFLILATFLSGFFLSAVNNYDSSWWQWSICALGMPMNQTELYYNLTLVLTGVLVFGLGLFIKPQLDTLIKKGVISQKKETLLTALFIIEALSITLVGVFPYGVNTPIDWIHNFFAYYSFAHIGFIILFSKKLFNNFPKNFFSLSYIIWVATFTFYFCNLFIKLIPAAIAEILVIVSVILWLMLLTRTIKLLSND